MAWLGDQERSNLLPGNDDESLVVAESKLEKAFRLGSGTKWGGKQEWERRKWCS
jgi:hypothetical protein